MGYQIVEWTATYIECSVMLALVLSACRPKYAGKKHIYVLLSFSARNTVLVNLLNSFSVFSYYTPIVSILFLFLSAKLLSNGSWMIRAAMSVIALFEILIIDYILFMTMTYILFHGDTNRAFSTIISPGILRSGYILIDKLMDIGVYFLFKKQLQKLSNLQKRWHVALLVSSILIYIIAEYSFSAILGGNYLHLQGTFILFFSFLLIFLVIVLMLLISLSTTESERIENQMLLLTSSMMQQNYTVLHEDLQSNAQAIHDFHHHLRTIRSMAEREHSKSILPYVDSILSASYREIELCHSGNDVIDAVINCNAVEAQKRHISFKYNVALHSTLLIDPVDICAILARRTAEHRTACR